MKLGQKQFYRMILGILLHSFLTNVAFFFLRGNDFACHEFLVKTTDSCSFHNYTKQEARECLKPKDAAKETKIEFIGDSHMRFLFEALLKLVDCPRKINKNKNSSSYCPQIKTLFKINWRTTLDPSISILLNSWRGKNAPDLIVQDCNLHQIRANAGSNDLKHKFRNDLTDLAIKMDNLAQETPYIWYYQPAVIEKLRKKHQMVITNELVLKYNQAVKEVLSPTHVHIWYTARERALNKLDRYADATHIGRETEAIYVQHLLNYYCNKKFDFEDGTCCKGKKILPEYNSRELFSIIYLSVFAVVLLVWVIAGCLPSQTSLTNQNLQESIRDSTNDAMVTKLTFKDVLSATFHLVVLVTFVYLVARTPLFPKYEKSPSPEEMWLLIASLFLMGCASLQTDYEADDYSSKLLKEAKGLLVTVFVLIEWANVPHVHQLTKDLLLTTAGLHFYKEFFVAGAIELKSLCKGIIENAFLAVMLSQLLLQPLQQYPLFLLLLINKTIAGLTLLLQPNSGDKRILGNLLKITCIWITNAVMFSEMHFIFNHAFWQKLFLTRDGTIKEWMVDYEKSSFSFSEGLLVGFAFHECHLRITSKANNPKKKMTTYSLLLLLGVFFVTISLIIIISIDFEKMGSYAPLCCLLVSGYLVLRICLVHLKPAFSSAFVGIGSVWVEAYLLCSNVAMLYNGHAALLLFPFNQYVNSLLVLLCLFFLAQSLRQNVSIISEYIFQS